MTGFAAAATTATAAAPGAARAGAAAIILGKSGKEILGYLLSGMKDSNYYKGIELIKSWESGETHWDSDKSVWWNINWKSKKPKMFMHRSLPLTIRF